MEWQVRSRRTLYRSWFVELHVDRVELPDGRIIDHEVVSVPRDGAATVAVDPDRGMLLIHRHRFITGVWGWEVPGGLVEPGEQPIEAAAREFVEETGWEPGPLEHLTSLYPASGLSDQRFHLFLAPGARHVGEPTEQNEASRIEWRSFEQVGADVRSGAIADGVAQFSVTLGLASVGRRPDGSPVGT